MKRNLSNDSSEFESSEASAANGEMDPTPENPQFRENLYGRLSNFPLSVEKPLYPLFEAISNSMHAIADARVTGRVVVNVHRKPPQTMSLMEEVKTAEEVCGFTIEDNGIGFNDRNFISFCTADSTFKKARGGKGVGRLSWLKAFAKAEIESVFNDELVSKKRSFTFTLTDSPIEDYKITDFPNGEKGTTVRLVGFRPEYQKHCPKNFETLARKVIEHFLTLFVLSDCPEIELRDVDAGCECSLNRMFEKEIGQHGLEESVTLHGHAFKVQHFRIATRSLSPEHQVHFCARSRSVESRDMGKYVANLAGVLHDELTGSFMYAAYVSGDLLDECVNQERTRLNLLHEQSLFTGQEEPTRELLLRVIAERSEEFLRMHLMPIRAKKLSRIQDYIQKRPRFRALAKLRPDWLDKIRPDVTNDDELDIELYKLMHRLEIEVRREGVQLQSQQTRKTTGSLEDHKKKFEKFLDESNQVGFSKLAEYVLHRRAVIDFLSECMDLKEDGRYPLEEVVHDVIFPMRASSSDIPDPDQSNLWMIDERLSYHYYLASDKTFKGTDEIKVKEAHEQKRVDLLVLQPYDRPHAFVGTTNRPFDSVTIIEFKRPHRNDFSEEEEGRDPVAQVWRYAEKIQNGRVKDRKGHYVKTGDGTQFFAYVICNLTPKMESLAKFHNFTPMPDNLGYFGWHTNFRVYTEILDYDKVLQDAKKRNEVFFDKFNLPPLR